MSKNLTLLIAGGRIKCRQCKARSKRTGFQCKAPAIKGKPVCKAHGGLSTGPKTAQGRERCAEARTIHGKDTRAKRTERSKKSAEFHQIVALGNALNLFHGEVKLRGRPPKLQQTQNAANQCSTKQHHRAASRRSFAEILDFLGLPDFPA
jgi:hypothetical protein